MPLNAIAILVEIKIGKTCLDGARNIGFYPENCI